MTFCRFLVLSSFIALFAIHVIGEESLSFPQAWDRVQRHNPDLSAARLSVEAAESTILQAGTRPNPNLSVEAENFGGDAPDAGWDSAETTLSVSQPLETGGKRQARRNEAKAAHALSKVELDATRLELWATLVTTYASALAANETLKLTTANARLARERHRLISARVKAGKVAPLESSRAAVESGLADVEHEKARRGTRVAYRRLAALYGQSEVTFTQLAGTLDVPRDWRSPQREGKLSPTQARAQQERAAREASLKREQSLAAPDIELSAGLRRFEADDHYAWVGAISLPLPLFNRNRGGIQKARHDLARAEAGEQSAKLAQDTEWDSLVSSAENEWKEIVFLRDHAIPSAQAAMEAAKIGYGQGKFSYLDWVDAERSLVALRSRRIEALTRYHATLANLGKLTGTIDEIQLFTH